MMYALPLENPPLLVVERPAAHRDPHPPSPARRARSTSSRSTNGSPEVQQRLRALWTDPEAFRPGAATATSPRRPRRTFAGTAERLRDRRRADRGATSPQCLFCIFAEDVGLLPSRLFERLVGVNVDRSRCARSSASCSRRCATAACSAWMPCPGSTAACSRASPYLNSCRGRGALKTASALNWSAIDPSIFGTLFERGLDRQAQPARRALHRPATIPAPRRAGGAAAAAAEWATQEQVAAAIARSRKHGDKAWRDAQAAFVGFLERLKAHRVLDPCVAAVTSSTWRSRCLKDIEHQVNLEAEALGLERQHGVTGPAQRAGHRAERMPPPSWRA